MSPSRETSNDLDLPEPPARDVYLSAVRAKDGSPVMFAVDSKGRSAGTSCCAESSRGRPQNAFSGLDWTR